MASAVHAAGRKPDNEIRRFNDIADTSSLANYVAMAVGEDVKDPTVMLLKELAGFIGRCPV
jgi:hypothetical protein